MLNLSDHLLQRVASKGGWLEPQLLRWHHAQRRSAIHLECTVGGGARRNVHSGNDRPVRGWLEWGGVGGARLWTELFFGKRLHGSAYARSRTRHQVFCGAIPANGPSLASAATIIHHHRPRGCRRRRDHWSRRRLPTLPKEEAGRPGRGGQHYHACHARGGRTCGPGRRGVG